MERVIIIRYSEIYLKGKNRGFFERAFETNLRRALDGFDAELVKNSGRYLIDEFSEDEVDEIIERLKKVFGLHTLSLAYVTTTDLDGMLEAALLVCPESGTFKVESHRGDKRYPMTSVEISRTLGGKILSVRHDLKVDVHNPDRTVCVDVREGGTALVFGEYIEGANGMPVGTAGKGLLLISGGIDSPVAASYR